jgi:cell division protein FtsZ
MPMRRTSTARLAKRKIHIGKNLTRGLGTGMNPELGRRAAEETRQEIQEALQGSDMVFITCGMGGGTGTGASAIVAKIAKELGALTIAVVTRPFSFEGAQRKRHRRARPRELKKEVDAFIIIPNDKLLTVVEPGASAKSAFALCDEILRQAVEGVSDIITTPGEINTDFNDIKAIMEGAGPRSWASASPMATSAQRKPRSAPSIPRSLMFPSRARRASSSWSLDQTTSASSKCRKPRRSSTSRSIKTRRSSSA